jgi:hypothetical protein
VIGLEDPKFIETLREKWRKEKAEYRAKKKREETKTNE